MSEPFSRPVILDATVLSNFASTDSVTWLATILDDPQTVPAVRTELKQGREVGYAYLEHATDVLESGRIGIAETAPEQLQHVASYAEALAEHKAREARLEEESEDDEIDERPDGLPEDVPSKATITIKEINDNRYYYYWQWREGDKIKSKYKAPVNPDE